MKKHFIFILIIQSLVQGACRSKSDEASNDYSVLMQTSCRHDRALSGGGTVFDVAKLLPKDLSARLKQDGQPRGGFSPKDMLFGTEIEFPLAEKFNNKEGMTSIRARFTAEMRKKCQACYRCNDGGVNPYIPGFRIKKNDVNRELVINIQIDPGVIEVTTSPMTLLETLSWQKELEDLVFDTARDLKAEGLLTDSDRERNRWSGHTNVSWGGLMFSGSSVEDAYAPQALRATNLLLNFYIDYANHPELALGVLGADIRNAPPWVLGDAKNRKQLYVTQKSFEQKEIKTPYEMAKSLALTAPVGFSGGYGSGRSDLPTADPGHRSEPKYSAFNVMNLLYEERDWGYRASKRIEMRAFFAPRSTGEMLANDTIILARLSMLAAKYEKKSMATEKISPSFTPSFPPTYTVEDHPTMGLLGGLTPSLAAKSYISYLRGAGLNPGLFSDFLRDSQLKAEVKRQMGCGFSTAAQ